MVAFFLSFNLLACAHNESQQTPLEGTQRGVVSQSVSWPLLPINEMPDPKVLPAIKNPQINIASQTANAAAMKKTSPTETSSLYALTPANHRAAVSGSDTSPFSAPTISPSSPTLVDSRVAQVLIRPRPIVIPKAKNADVDFDKSVSANDSPLIFDIPVAYNNRVKFFIEYFQTTGRPWYSKWLERSSRYLPLLQKTLKKNGLPQDLAYIAMIESGFSSQASSTAKAVGPWQFIRETGKRYGLQVTWWIDERRDFQKSTDAAAKYLKKMYGMFHNWYLVAAGYNTGENRIKRIIAKQGTKNFWKLAQKRDLEAETKDYVPKLIAALLIAKAPQMYGFKNINYSPPLSYEAIRVPGGTRLDALADAIGITPKYLAELNPELVRGYIPNYVDNHTIRVPKGASQLVGHFIRKSIISER